MIQEPLAGIASPIHALDPRARLAASLALTLTAALARGAEAPALILAVGFVCTILAQPSWKHVLRQAMAVNGFIALLWLLLPLTAPGPEIATPLGLAVSRPGLDMAALITLKANAVFFCVLALLATIPVTALGQAMTALGIPAKLAFLFVFTYRYVHVLAEEYARMRQVAALRGFEPATDRRTYRTYGALVAMVLVRGHDRAQRVYQAMLLRGFQGSFPSLHRFHFSATDGLFLLLAGSVTGAALALELPAWRPHV
ncbi:MAG: cobalt ECF transporter T component CbiQ [Pseudomonadota bacterium]